MAYFGETKTACMVIIKTDTKVINSEFTNPNDEEFDSLVKPVVELDFSFIRIKGTNYTEFIVINTVKVEYSAKSRYFFSGQDTTTFDEEGQKPDVEKVFIYLKEALSRIAIDLNVELNTYHLRFEKSPSVKFSKSELIQQIARQIIWGY